MFSQLIQKISFQDPRKNNRLKRLLLVEVSSLEKQDEGVVDEFYKQLEHQKTVYLDDSTRTYGCGQFIAQKAIDILVSKSDIKHICLSNTTADSTLNVLNAAIKNHHVQRVSLYNISLSVAGIKKLAELIRQMPHLVTLEFQKIQLIFDQEPEPLSAYDDYEALFQILFDSFSKTFPNLKCVKFSDMLFTGRSGQKFFDNLSTLPLLSLNLSNCKFSMENITALCTYMQRNLSLKDLLLRNINMYPECELAQDLPNKVALRHSAFLQNIFFQSLTAVLPYATALEYFDFSSNHIQNERIESFARAIHALNLHTLVLRDNLIDEHSVALLKKALRASAVLEVDVYEESFVEERVNVAPLLSQNNTYFPLENCQPQPFEWFHTAPYKNFAELTGSFASVLLKAVHADHTARDLYFLLSRCLADFHAGARSVSSGLVEPSVRNPLYAGVDQSLELALNFMGFFNATAAMLVPVTVTLVVIRETIKLTAQAKSKRECSLLLSLIDPKDSTYLETIFPALVALVMSSQEEPFDKVYLMQKMFHSWKKIAILNQKLNNYLTQRPMLWLMHVLHDLFQANSMEHVNHLIRHAWLNIMHEMPKPSLPTEQLHVVQKRMDEMEAQTMLHKQQLRTQQQQILLQKQQLQSQQQHIERQERLLARLGFWQAYFPKEHTLMLGEPFYPLAQEDPEEYMTPRVPTSPYKVKESEVELSEINRAAFQKR